MDEFENNDNNLVTSKEMKEISEKELSLRRMGLSPWQDGVIKLAVSNKEKRKQLWDIWRTNNPESKKTGEQIENKVQIL